MAFFNRFACAAGERDQGLERVESKKDVREEMSRSSWRGVRGVRRRRVSWRVVRKGERVPFARTGEPMVRVERRAGRREEASSSAVTFAAVFVYVAGAVVSS